MKLSKLFSITLHGLLLAYFIIFNNDYFFSKLIINTDISFFTFEKIVNLFLICKIFFLNFRMKTLI